MFSELPVPPIYYRYIGDTFVQMDAEKDLQTLRNAFIANSSLNFTYESSDEGNSLSLLDIEVKQKNGGFQTEVYVKPTNLGQFLNDESECPQKYKDSVVGTFIRMALTCCSSWSGTYRDLERVSQNLVNNEYPNRHINNTTKNVLNKWYKRPTTLPLESGNIKLYYRAFMSSKYKEDNKIMRRIITDNIAPVHTSKKIKLIMNYKNIKIKNLLMRNHPKPNEDLLKECMVVYHFA